MKNAPDSLKTDNWTLYEHAMSADPSIACQYIVKLCISLTTTMRVTDIHEFDPLLKRETLGARKAWFQYIGEKNPGRAMQTVSEVLKNIGFLLYDDRFAIHQARAFTGRQ